MQGQGQPRARCELRAGPAARARPVCWDMMYVPARQEQGSVIRHSRHDSVRHGLPAWARRVLVSLGQAHNPPRLQVDVDVVEAGACGQACTRVSVARNTCREHVRGNWHSKAQHVSN